MNKRCDWCGEDPLYVSYHDKEWGVPVYDDDTLFEFLLLEGAQAGLSWITVLRKREGYRKAFDGFDFQKIARYTDKKLNRLMKDEGIIRNRLKIFSARGNAIAFMQLQKEYGSFSDFIWSYVDRTPVVNRVQKMSDVASNTELSDSISKDLKKKGFKFVGSTIIYAFLQAAGLVNDHAADCFRFQECQKLAK
jgi:DNA-3-methyladenine glycosylase I